MEERWIKVAVAPNETSALLMDGVLKDAGVPALIQRAPPLAAPDLPSSGAPGAPGPRARRAAAGRRAQGRGRSGADPTRPRLRRPGLPLLRSQGRAGAGCAVRRGQADPRGHHGPGILRAVADPAAYRLSSLPLTRPGEQGWLVR